MMQYILPLTWGMAWIERISGIQKSQPDGWVQALLQQGHSEQDAQHHVQMAFEDLQGRNSKTSVGDGTSSVPVSAHCPLFYYCMTQNKKYTPINLTPAL